MPKKLELIDRNQLIEALKSIDVKRLELDHEDENYVKWFRFGNYNALRAIVDIVNLMPLKEPKKKKDA